MANDILSEIIERRNEDIKSKGFDFGFEIPQKRTRRIHPFLLEKGVILEVKRTTAKLIRRIQGLVQRCLMLNVLRIKITILQKQLLLQVK